MLIIVARIFTIIAALIHIIFFLFESILWLKPEVYSRFGLTESEALGNSLLAFNQGFYNLFLALGCFVGIFLLKKQSQSGEALIFFCLCAMFCASIILILSAPNLISGALTQGLAPFIALVCYSLALRNS
jgi:putative membrane protein